MGKHERGYERVDRDHYPTPEWVTLELFTHFPELYRKTIWEPAAGTGEMARALRRPARSVFCTDIVDRGFPLDRLQDFTVCRRPLRRPFAIVTNPPFGPRGALAVEFIHAGLWHLWHGVRLLALLLPVDFDSAGTRYELFGGCKSFVAKIVLTQRIVWFQRTDGVKEAPKENHCWYIWERVDQRPLRAPLLLYQHQPN